MINCLNRNVIPIGFNLNFHLALNVDNANLNMFCEQSLQRTSIELCNAENKKITDEVLRPKRIIKFFIF